MLIDCEFREIRRGPKLIKDYFYECLVYKKEIPENGEFAFKGNHVYNARHIHVTAIKFNFCPISIVPQGLMEIFPNLRSLEINYSNIENLNKADLVEYKKLDFFLCRFSKIKFLPGDLFEDFEHLEWIDMADNEIKFIEPNIFDGFKNMIYVDFRRNANYDFFYQSVNPNLSGGGEEFTVQDVKKELIKNCFTQEPETTIAFYQRLQNQFHDLKKAKNESDKKVQEDNFKDFKIEIDDREFPVHKFILSIRSPILAEMLRNNPDDQSLRLVNIPIEIFKIILKFFYTDELPREDQMNFFDVFAAASRLEIKKLKDYAAEIILSKINAENALEILELSNKYGHDGMRQQAFEQIKLNYRLNFMTAVDFKDDFAMDTEKVKKFIELFNKIETIGREIADLIA